MTADVEAYRERIATAVTQAIYNASLVDVDGEQRAVLNVAAICDAMVVAMAAIVEPAPACQTTKGVRELSETIARDLRARVRQMRTVYEQTGRRAIGGEVIYPS